jgi:hypothetical protein
LEPTAIALLPNAGLGNKLIVWARCMAFAQLNGLSATAIGWNYPKIGPILRRQRRDIFYGQNLNTPPLSGRICLLLQTLCMDRQYEPVVQRFAIGKRTAYFFTKMPHWSDLFGSIHLMRSFVVRAFSRLISPTVLIAIENLPPPLIGVHVRRGDFRELVEGEKFAEVGGARTPLEYFVTVIRNIRACAGWVIPVAVFSDGSDDELTPVLALENVYRVPAMTDVGHLAFMARSDVIVASAGSTFSMWAGFVSEAALILHPDHIHAPIRPTNLHDGLYEGPALGSWNNWNASLIKKVQSLRPRCGSINIAQKEQVSQRGPRA